MAIMNGLPAGCRPSRFRGHAVRSEPDAARRLPGGRLPAPGSRRQSPAPRQRQHPASRTVRPARARSGRNTSWPAALAAVSSPIARPLLATNQRFATAAAMPTAPAPEPMPTITPQVRNNCHGEDMSSDRPVPAANSDHAPRMVRFSPITCTRPVKNGPVKPIEHDVDRHGGGDRADAPAESALQRQNHDAGSRTHADPGKHREEHHDEHDPGIVHAAGKELRNGGRFHKIKSVAKRPPYRSVGIRRDPRRRMAAARNAAAHNRMRRLDPDAAPALFAHIRKPAWYISGNTASPKNSRSGAKSKKAT